MINPGDKVWVVFEPTDLQDISEGNLVVATVHLVECNETIGEQGSGLERRYVVDFGMERATKHESFVYMIRDKELAAEHALSLCRRREDRLRNELERVLECKAAISA